MKLNRLFIGRLCLALVVSVFMFAFTGSQQPKMPVGQETQLQENIDFQDLVTVRTSIEAFMEVHSISIFFRFISPEDIYSRIISVKLSQLEIKKILFQTNYKIYLRLRNLLV
ncbi:MAG: hypothetical protein ACK47E_13475 [Cyclobacteriaceae bacterium]